MVAWPCTPAREAKAATISASTLTVCGSIMLVMFEPACMNGDNLPPSWPQARPRLYVWCGGRMLLAVLGIFVSGHPFRVRDTRISVVCQ